ncbi:MAG: hypothetical protein ABIQ52_12395 [Vicinamibacterales bacterium]
MDPRHEGPVTEAGLRQKVEACGYQVSTFTWPLGGEAAILTAGDLVHIPRGAVRRIAVIGSAPAHGVHAVERHSH